MKGETHALLGTAAAVSIINPQLPGSFIVTCSFAFLGSLLPDVDTKSSLIRRPHTFIALFIVNYFFIDFHSVVQKTGFKIGALAMILLAIYAAVKTSHRTFTHSFLAFILFSASLYLAYPEGLAAFAYGYLCHMIADSFTVHGVPFLYPFVSRTFGLKFLSTGSPVESIIIALSSVVIAYKLLPVSGVICSFNVLKSFIVN